MYPVIDRVTLPEPVRSVGICSCSSVTLSACADLGSGAFYVFFKMAKWVRSFIDYVNYKKKLFSAAARAFHGYNDKCILPTELWPNYTSKPPRKVPMLVPVQSFHNQHPRWIRLRWAAMPVPSCSPPRGTLKRKCNV